MKRLVSLFIFVVCITSFAHLLAKETPIRLYRVGSVPSDGKTPIGRTQTAQNFVIKNEVRTPDIPDADLVYRGKEPAEILTRSLKARQKVVVQNEALRYDVAYLSSKPFAVGKSGFTVWARVRKYGQGKAMGNGLPNGTIFALGNGYEDGFRLITDSPRRTLRFEMGQKEGAFGLSGTTPVPDGCWVDMAVSWDYKVMRIYVDGMLYAAADYDGKFTEPQWEFRIGFNNAGVGSVKLDVAMVAVYSKALLPMELAALSFRGGDFKTPSADFARLYNQTVEAAQGKDWKTAETLLGELQTKRSKNPIEEKYQKHWLPLFHAELLSRQGFEARAQQMYASMLADGTLSDDIAEKILYHFLPRDLRNPFVADGSEAYKIFLKKGEKPESTSNPVIDLTPEQKTALQICLYRSLLLEGKTVEAAKIKEQLPVMQEQELSRYDFAHWKTEKAERETEEKRFRETGSAWETPKSKNPVPATFKPSVVLHVKLDGDGKTPNTLTSLQQARDAIRKIRTENGGKLPDGGVEVRVHGSHMAAGETRNAFFATETLELTAEDSGTPEAPIVYRNAGVDDERRPVFSGGKRLDVNLFQPLAEAFKKGELDRKTVERLPKESRGKVLVIDLKAAGVDVAKLPPVPQRGYGFNGPHAAPWLDFYVEGKPMQIARYPNAGTTAENTPEPLRTGEVFRGKMNTLEDDGREPPIFAYSDARIERWKDAADPWVMGYWGHLYACNASPITKIDTKNKRVELGKRNSFACRKNMPYYAFNLLEEIDVPGEFYIDREGGKLYLYPPDGMEPFSGYTVILPVFDKPFIRMKNCSYTFFLGLNFEDGCGSGALVDGGKHVVFAGCGFRRLGNWALAMKGSNHGVLGCDLETLGGGGVEMNGGNYRTLEPGNCYIENCLVRNFTRIDRAYAPAVLLLGSGNRISHNLFCDSPHHAIRLEGMEQIVEYNEIHGVVYESDDQSGIDIWHNPYMRGFVMRYNYFHHIGSGRNIVGQAGIRLDDMISSVLMYGNVFLRSSGGQFGGIHINGGKDNILDNNLFIDCKRAFGYFSWGEKRWIQMLDKVGPVRRQAGFDPDSPGYKEKYPDFTTIRENIDRNFVTRNLAVACDRFTMSGQDRNEHAANWFISWRSELFAETSNAAFKPGDRGRVPGTVTAMRKKLTIPYDAPIWEKTGMRPLPFPLMGLYKDEFRTEIPDVPVSPLYVAE